MIIAADFPIEIKRRQQFRLEVGYPGLDLSTSAFSMEVRENRDADPPAVSIAVGEGADGVTRTLSQVDGAPYTLVVFTVSRGTVDTLPAATPMGTDLDWWYAIKQDGNEILSGVAVIRAAANHI